MKLASDLDAYLLDAGFTADPYPTYAALREVDPVHWSDAWGVWVLTRYDDILAVLKDASTFSNADRYGTLMRQLPLGDQEAAAAVTRHNSEGMLQSDPPDHTRLRALVRQAFTPRVIEQLRPQVAMIVDGLLDDFDGAPFDIVGRLAFRLPISVICSLMDLPIADADVFARWAEDVAGFQATGRAVSDNARRAAAAIVEVERYFSDVIRVRAQRPGQDLISLMIGARDVDDRMSHGELINMSVNLLFAGHQTTEHLIGNAIYTLLSHPEGLASALADPAVMSSAIEECLRFESPVQRGWRRATRDVEVRGKWIHAGELVYLMFGAANRDPEVFRDPDEFRVLREPNRHLAFGYGIHFCIGAPLARIEVPMAVSRLFDRYPAVHVIEPVEWSRNIHLRGLTSLWLSP